MAETIKKGDFIEIEYTGKVKNTGLIFDLTDEKLAKEKGIFNPHINYGPTVICVGQKDVINGLDEQLENKESGKQYAIELGPEEAFGKKNTKLIKTFSLTKFREQKINPVPGMQVNMDGILGTVRAVTGGRTIVDFNHPLAGKEIVYEVKINNIITNTSERLRGFLRLHLSMKEPEVEIKENVAKVKVKEELPKEFEKELVKKIVEIITPLKDVKFILENK